MQPEGRYILGFEICILCSLWLWKWNLYAKNGLLLTFEPLVKLVEWLMTWNISSSFLINLLAYINSTCCIVDPHGTPKVNIWQDPLSPSKWKEEHVSNLWFLESLFLVQDL